MTEITHSRKLTRLEAIRKRGNSIMMRLAGQRFFFLSILEHKGRRSGHVYSTPVMATKTRDGFVIPLAYGEEVDWNRNLLTSGNCTIRKDGRAYKMGNPQVIDKKDVLPLIPPVRRVWFWLFPTRKYMRVTKAK